MNAPLDLAAMQKAADHATARKSLRAAGLGALIFGALALFAGLVPPPSWMLIFLGVLLLVVGGWNRTRVHPLGFVASGASLALIGLLNIGSRFLEAADGGRPSVFWQVLGVWQIIWGVQEIRRYRRFAGVCDRDSRDPLVKQMDRQIDGVRKAKVKMDPDVVEVVAAGFKPRVVRFRLMPEFAFCLINPGPEVRIVERGRLLVQTTEPATTGTTRKVRIGLADLTIEGRIPTEKLLRLQTWTSGVPESLRRVA